MARIRVLSALKIKQNLTSGMYADGLGLYLKVRDCNSKSWIFRYRTKGKLRDSFSVRGGWRVRQAGSFHRIKQLPDTPLFIAGGKARKQA